MNNTSDNTLSILEWAIGLTLGALTTLHGLMFYWMSDRIKANESRVERMDADLKQFRENTLTIEVGRELWRAIAELRKDTGEVKVNVAMLPTRRDLEQGLNSAVERVIKSRDHH